MHYVIHLINNLLKVQNLILRSRNLPIGVNVKKVNVQETFTVKNQTVLVLVTGGKLVTFHQSTEECVKTLPKFR